jgi:hypothetical protein
MLESRLAGSWCTDNGYTATRSSHTRLSRLCGSIGHCLSGAVIWFRETLQVRRCGALRIARGQFTVPYEPLKARSRPHTDFRCSFSIGGPYPATDSAVHENGRLTELGGHETGVVYAGRYLDGRTGGGSWRLRSVRDCAWSLPTTNARRDRFWRRCCARSMTS